MSLNLYTKISAMTSYKQISHSTCTVILHRVYCSTTTHLLNPQVLQTGGRFVRQIMISLWTVWVDRGFYHLMSLTQFQDVLLCFGQSKNKKAIDMGDFKICQAARLTDTKYEIHLWVNMK